MYDRALSTANFSLSARCLHSMELNLGELENAVSVVIFCACSLHVVVSSRNCSGVLAG
jgi:hypothetical protein